MRILRYSIEELLRRARLTWANFFEGSAPGTPDSGEVRLYAKSDGKLYIKDDTGAETDLTAGGVGFNDAEGDPANVATAAADGTSANAARRDHAHALGSAVVATANVVAGAITQQQNSALTTDVLNVSADTNLTTVTLTATGAPIIIIGSVTGNSNTAGARFDALIREGTTDLAATVLHFTSATAGALGGLSPLVVRTPVAGSITYALRISKGGTAGTSDFFQYSLVAFELKR